MYGERLSNRLSGAGRKTEEGMEKDFEQTEEGMDRLLNMRIKLRRVGRKTGVGCEKV